MRVIVVGYTINIISFVTQKLGLGCLFSSRDMGVSRPIVCRGLHNTEVIAVPQWDGGCYWSSTPDVDSPCLLIRSFGLPESSVFAYCPGFFVNSTGLQLIVVGCNNEVGMSVLLIDAFLRAVYVDPVKRL